MLRASICLLRVRFALGAEALQSLSTCDAGYGGSSRELRTRLSSTMRHRAQTLCKDSTTWLPGKAAAATKISGQRQCDNRVQVSNACARPACLLSTDRALSKVPGLLYNEVHSSHNPSHWMTPHLGSLPTWQAGETKSCCAQSRVFSEKFYLLLTTS